MAGRRHAMTAYQGVRVAATTTGIASSPFEEYRVNYVYGGDKRDDEPFSASMADSSAERKRQRLAKLAELQAIDPPLSVAEKARRLQVASRTVREYERLLAGQDEAAAS